MKDKEMLIKLLTKKNSNKSRMTYEDISKLTGYHVKSLIRINKTIKQKGIEAVIVHGNLGKKKSSLSRKREENFIVEQKKIHSGMNFLQFYRYYNDLVSDNAKYKDYNLKPRSYSYIYNILAKAGIISLLRHNWERNDLQSIDKCKSLLILKDIEIKLLNRNRQLTLFLAVDVTQNQVIYMHISQKENKPNYYLMLKSIVKDYGVPESIYAHGLTIFRAPKNNITQFHRMCNELNINIYLNYDRKLQKLINMIKKDLLKGLLEVLSTKSYNSTKEMNFFIKNEYMQMFNNLRYKSENNSKYSKPDLDNIIQYILCEKHKRKIVYQDSYNNVQFRNVLYHIEGLETKLDRGAEVSVYVYLNGDVRVYYNHKLYQTSVIKKLSSVKQ